MRTCDKEVDRGEDMVASAWFKGASATLDVLWRLWLSALCNKAIGLIFIIIA
jgi:hypothetical protein